MYFGTLISNIFDKIQSFPWLIMTGLIDVYKITSLDYVVGSPATINALLLSIKF